MDFIVETFNNREIAGLIWLIVLAIALMTKQSIRNSFLEVIKAFFQKNILIIFLAILSYGVLQVFVLKSLSLWDMFLIKSTIYWIIFIAFALLLNVNQVTADKHYFKHLLQQNIKFIVIVEFLVNFYSFSLIAELFIFPIVTFSVITQAYTENKEKYADVHKIANFLLGVIGFTVLIICIIKIINDFNGLWEIQNLQSFLLPILLVITFTPFLYFFALSLRYEILLSRLKRVLNKELLKYSKRRILFSCNFQLPKLNRFIWFTVGKLMSLKNKADIDKLLMDFKESN